MVKMVKNGGPDLKRAQRTGPRARRAQMTKSWGLKGLQLEEVRARRAPTLLVFDNVWLIVSPKGNDRNASCRWWWSLASKAQSVTATFHQSFSSMWVLSYQSFTSPPSSDGSSDSFLSPCYTWIPSFQDTSWAPFYAWCLVCTTDQIQPQTDDCWWGG